MGAENSDYEARKVTPVHINTIPIKALQCIVLNKQINITGYETKTALIFL